MKYIRIILFIGLSPILYTSCKKSSNNADPIVSQRPPDTLTSGWARIEFNPIYGGSINDIFFKNNTTGYAAGSGSTFKSVDAGLTWNKIVAHGFSNIAMTDDGKVFFVNGSQDSVFKTIDGGATMTRYYLPSTTVHDIFFADNDNGLCSGSAGIFGTTDGGNSWTNITTLPGIGSYSSLFMLNSTTAWVVYGNHVYHCNGSLSNWQMGTVNNTTPGFTLTTVFATSASVVYTSNEFGTLYKSIDGGATFILLKQFDNFWPSYISCDLHFTDANTGYINVANRIYKTTDAGNNWNLVAASGNSAIIELHFTDATHGWACLADGTIYKYN